jgi:hypothetical protein
MLLLSLNLFTRQTLRVLPPFVSLCLFLPGLTQGAEWAIKGAVDQSLGYDDNVRMRQDAQGSFEYRIIPELTFLRRTDSSEIQANASYGTQVYTDLPQFNRDIQKYGLNGLYKTERFDWGLATDFSITPARNTALQDSSGNGFNTNSNKSRWSVSPSVSYKIDEIDSIILTPAYSETTFTSRSAANPGDVGSTFRNNTTTNVNLAWQRLWTERYSSTVSFLYSNLKSQRGNAGTLNNQSFAFDSVSINFSNTYLWSENWILNGGIGVRHTDSESNSMTSSTIGLLANAGIDYKDENFSSGINFNRSLKPSNQGQLQEQTGVGLNFSYQIVEKLSVGLTTSYLHSTQINAVNQSTRENIVVQPSINWQFMPELTLTGSYRYRTRNQDRFQDGVSANTIVDSNLFMLSINYNWQGLSISR